MKNELEKKYGSIRIIGVFFGNDYPGNGRRWAEKRRKAVGGNQRKQYDDEKFVGDASHRRHDFGKYLWCDWGIFVAKSPTKLEGGKIDGQEPPAKPDGTGEFDGLGPQPPMAGVINQDILDKFLAAGVVTEDEYSTISANLPTVPAPLDK